MKPTDHRRDSLVFGFMPRAETSGEATAVVDRNRWLRPGFSRFFSKLD